MGFLTAKRIGQPFMKKDDGFPLHIKNIIYPFGATLRSKQYLSAPAVTLVTFETTFVISSTEKIYINKERNFERHISVANAK